MNNAQSSDDANEKLIRWLAAAAETGRGMVNAAEVMKAANIGDTRSLTIAARYWDHRGAVAKTIDSLSFSRPDGEVIALEPSPQAPDLLHQWEREKAETQRPDLVAGWTDRARRHPVTAGMMVARYAITFVIGTVTGVIGVASYVGVLESPGSNASSTAVTEAGGSREITARTFPVQRVIDGNTIVILYDGEPTSIRIPGIDTPGRDEPGFSRATEAMRELVEERVVTIEFLDPDDKRDDFGRLVARVRVNGVDVGEVMLERGHARVYAD